MYQYFIFFIAQEESVVWILHIFFINQLLDI